MSKHRGLGPKDKVIVGEGRDEYSDQGLNNKCES